MTFSRSLAIAFAFALTTSVASSQEMPPGSSNMRLQSHLPMGGAYTMGDIEIEQEMSRPYVYLTRTFQETGFDVISVKSNDKSTLMYSWRIPNVALHLGASVGGTDGHYFKTKGRYYFAESFQFRRGAVDGNLGAILFDMTGLPDTSKIKEAARIEYAEVPGGFHTIYPYKHSDGRSLLFTTTNNAWANIYDLDKVLAGDAAGALVGKVPWPATNDFMGFKGYHDFYIAYDPATKQDKFYGAGLVGYYLYDVTNPAQAKLITSIEGAAGTYIAHTFTATPDGRYAVTQTEYQYSPLKIFDLKPGLDGTVKTISRPIGAWTANWKTASHNNEIRWPYVFVASLDEGLQVINIMDPTNPYTVGYYGTAFGPKLQGFDMDMSTGLAKGGNSIFNGPWGIDIRNADGLIVTGDFRTGFWSFKMEGFDGWNGHQWGMPNISSAQDWDNGPDGAPKQAKVS